MSRYLTPSKVTLLTLIDLYLTKSAASTAAAKLLQYISHYVVGNDTRLSAGTEPTTFVFSIEDVVRDLSQWQTGIPGRTVADILLDRLWAFENVDSLHVLFERLGHIVGLAARAEPELNFTRISPASPFGVYIRRCCVEFTRLQFADILKLWAALKAYRQPTYQQWAQKHPDAALRAREDVLQLADDDHYDDDYLDFQMSAEDVSTLLSASITKLQKYGTRVPEEVKHKIQEWILVQKDYAQSSQHFLEFFDHWKAGQYTYALESLHRYFDYSLATKTGSDNLKAYYQYALLHLSVLHADFECLEQSVEAMEECIATARENQDHVCLSFALSWQLYLQQTYTGTLPEDQRGLSALMKKDGNGLDEIAFLKSMAKEGRHWTLLCGALLEEAKVHMTSGSSAVKSFESILQSCYLSVQHDLRTLLSGTSLFLAAGYHRLGQSHLAVRGYESIDIVHTQYHPVSDRVRASCRLAMDLSSSGKYRDAMTILDQCAATGEKSGIHGVLKMEQLVLASKMLVQTRLLLFSGKLEESERSLADLRPVMSFGEPELRFEVRWLEIESLLLNDRLDEAMDKVNLHIEELSHERQPDIARRLRLMLMKSRIFAAAGHAPKGFSITLRAAAMAQRHLLLTILTEACEVLCNILNKLGEWQAAQDLGTAVLPMAIEQSNLHVTARLWIIVGESHVGLAGNKCAPGSAKRASHLKQALPFFERGLEAYMSLKHLYGALYVLTMRSRVFRVMGDEHSANSANERYQQFAADGFG